MKIAESWLREWVDPELNSEELAHQLTMLGHEVDAVEIEGEGLDGVIVGEVLAVAMHPDADRLSVCQVSTGSGEPLEIVCGAPNVVQGMKTPLAQPGVTLPNGLKLRKSKIRGVVSNGMLCSAVELGLGDESDGIMHLPDDAPTGADIAAYLGLPDAVIDVDLTPNRGDCFSILGIARDVSALTGAELKRAEVDGPKAVTERSQPVELVEPGICPTFAGRVIEGIDSSARSPLWMVERLRRAGLREIHPVVDVTNYVMLELGQPLHGYDLDLIQGAIRPRRAKGGEALTLLDEKAVELVEGTIAITDDSGVIGLAGIMGGLSTAVTDATVNVFFEGAYWPPAAMAGRARSYGLHTDASLRFERGVDPGGQARAVERATALLVEIAGGKPGPLVIEQSAADQPERKPVRLRRARLAMLLGAEIADDEVERILEGLGLTLAATDDGWQVTPPSHRFDIVIEADLIEEIARIYGYDRIPKTTAIAATPLETVTETSVDPDLAAATLVGRDYQEAITYSFVDAADNTLIAGEASELELSNPISSEMSVMRSSLWPGLLHAAATNLARQQDRVRLFEIGRSYHGTLEAPDEVVRIAAVTSGSALPEQWGANTRPVDFFDVKADVMALIGLGGSTDDVRFESLEHPALQPGQSAAIRRGDRDIGLLGKLHPNVARHFELKRPTYVFELDAMAALASSAPRATPVSRFPAIRRDIAVVVAESVTASQLADAIKATNNTLIRSVRIFDIYTGPGIEAGLKSVALGLILQETSRTLTDEDADAAVAVAVQKLQQDFGAELRD
ncbi:MAG: phenylalanine--tRNA ligase subunit beta [Woeseiaceae bacterium]|jgi:phenylalanyl-tRNA synthetase beta chain|nr:phenylalanine--tRNA ligase subunit beta [Woeseiaceae bacterium]